MNAMSEKTVAELMAQIWDYGLACSQHHESARERGIAIEQAIRRAVDSAALSAKPAQEMTDDPGPLLDDEGRAMVGASHHYTAENIRALIAELKRLEDPQQCYSPYRALEQKDIRAWCGVLWRVMSGLACDVPLAANRASRLPEHDRNMDGAREFVDAILMNQPMWPNPWGQDVAAAAFFLTDGGKRDRWQAERRLPEMGEDDWPEMPEPAMEDVPYELWGQNVTHPALYTADQLRAHAAAAVEKYKALVRGKT